MQIPEVELYVFWKRGSKGTSKHDTKSTNNRGCKSCTAEKGSALNRPPLPPSQGVKSIITNIPGKEFLQSVRNLQFGIPQGGTEFLFQSFHKLLKLLCTDLRREEIEMLSTSISRVGKAPLLLKCSWKTLVGIAGFELSSQKQQSKENTSKTLCGGCVCCLTQQRQIQSVITHSCKPWTYGLKPITLS